jgi:hypothetical protein
LPKKAADARAADSESQGLSAGESQPVLAFSGSNVTLAP